MRYYQRSIAFDRLITDDEYKIQLHPATYIVFWNYMIDNKQSEEDFFNYYLFESCLSKELRSTYKYTSPSISYDNKIALKDTVFLKGVELSWYTSEVFEYFNYDTASINNFFNNEVYFTINDVINVCNDYSKVSGTFSTKSINRGEIFSIENGKFTFITK
ncbi:hypothetical protein [Carboxylicivirga linearis]|uniref:Uncharacterized protein n=1 Tax=Carboxylicivirga linearis TaxID=1628157 RepID=A0ABS5JXD2_9BACT|nr:hypothetical protein [Carboxylicivirga linearis]MBS2099518.1 hypothetical protein [Carboxylicivirga linearis]